MLQVGVEKAVENGVRDVADTGLQRQQVLRHSPLLDLVVVEVQKVAGDLAGVVVNRLERGVAVGAIGLDDRRDLVLGDVEELVTDPVTGVGDRDGHSIRRKREPTVDVVHSLEVLGLPRVHLDDDLVGDVTVHGVVADRGGEDDVPILSDSGGLNDGVVDLSEKALTHHHARLRQVNVGVEGCAVVDLVSHLGIGLVWHAPADAIDGGEGAVEFGSGRGSGEDVDGELLAAIVGFLDALGQCARKCLGVARPSESTESDLVTVIDERSRVVRAHHLLTQGCVRNPL